MAVSDIFFSVLCGTMALGFSICLKLQLSPRPSCNRSAKVSNDVDEISESLSLKRTNRRDFILNRITIKRAKCRRTSFSSLVIQIKTKEKRSSITEFDQEASIEQHETANINKEMTQSSLMINSDNDIEEVTSSKKNADEIKTVDTAAATIVAPNNDVKKNYLTRALLGLTSYFKADHNDDKHTIPKCNICLTDFSDTDDVCSSRNVDCKHTFHTECIVEWLMDHDKCPCCQVDFFLSFSNKENIFEESNSEDGRIFAESDNPMSSISLSSRRASMKSDETSALSSFSSCLPHIEITPGKGESNRGSFVDISLSSKVLH